MLEDLDNKLFSRQSIGGVGKSSTNSFRFNKTNYGIDCVDQKLILIVPVLVYTYCIKIEKNPLETQLFVKLLPYLILQIVIVVIFTRRAALHASRPVLKNLENPKQFVCMFKRRLKEISILFFQVLESLS